MPKDYALRTQELCGYKYESTGKCSLFKVPPSPVINRIFGI